MEEKIIEVLKKKNDWMSVREIAYELREDMKAVRDLLRLMYKTKEVLKQKVQTIRGNNYIWKISEKTQDL